LPLRRKKKREKTTPSRLCLMPTKTFRGKREGNPLASTALKKKEKRETIVSTDRRRARLKGGKRKKEKTIRGCGCAMETSKGEEKKKERLDVMLDLHKRTCKQLVIRTTAKKKEGKRTTAVPQSTVQSGRVVKEEGKGVGFGERKKERGEGKFSARCWSYFRKEGNNAAAEKKKARPVINSKRQRHRPKKKKKRILSVKKEGKKECSIPFSRAGDKKKRRRGRYVRKRRERRGAECGACRFGGSRKKKKSKGGGTQKGGSREREIGTEPVFVVPGEKKKGQTNLTGKKKEKGLANSQEFQDAEKKKRSSTSTSKRKKKESEAWSEP